LQARRYLKESSKNPERVFEVSFFWRIPFGKEEQFSGKAPPAE
jgi:hypothetical protein